MPDPVRQPTALECCRAATGFVTGLVRPRRPDERFLKSIVDAGLPEPSRTVRVTALRQVPRTVPTFGVVEGTLRPRTVRNSMTTFVVRHPDATFVVDPSICLDVERRALAELPPLLRTTVRPPAATVPTITALRERPDLPPPDFALPTHAHWDHVCGLLDLPGLPVHLHTPERAWIMGGAVAPVGGVRASLRDRPVVEYELDGPPVLTFPRSHDLFGDGTVLLVDLAGHTPGSVGVLVHSTNGWVLLAGDAVWHALQVDQLRQKPGFPGDLADDDRPETFRTIHRLHVARHLVRIVPTHDHDAAVALAQPTVTKP